MGNLEKGTVNLIFKNHVASKICVDWLMFCSWVLMQDQEGSCSNCYGNGKTPMGWQVSGRWLISKTGEASNERGWPKLLGMLRQLKKGSEETF